MKRSQFVVIALAGWYLLLPPPAGSNRRLVYAPLSLWKKIDTFDTQRQCENIRRQLIARMPGTAIDTSRCVSSEDPRLSLSPAEITME
jgi:hypothetical protein